jgi:purine-binding chemotaxis protein CheW
MNAPVESAEGATALRLVGFRIADWRFCIRLAQVQTSLMPCEITRVFHTPEFIRGIISLRGIIVCVLDLGRLLGLAGRSDSQQRFLVVSDSGVQAAIPVGEVFRIPEIPADLIEPLPASVDPAKRAILEGVINTAGLEGVDGRTGQDTLTLIDAGTLFEAPEVAALRSRR